MAVHRLSGEERRRQIVAVTLEVIATHGVAAASTKRIAAAAGVSEATLYKHFASRQEIFVAALDEVYEHVYELIDSSRGADAVERLRAVGRGHLELLSSRSADFVFPLFEFVAAPPGMGLRGPLAEKQSKAVRALAAIIVQGQHAGAIRRDADPEQAAWELIGVFWLRDVSYLMGLEEPVFRSSSVLLDTVLESIASDHRDTA